MYGRQPRWNVDFLLNCVDESCQTASEYAAATLTRLNSAFELTRQHLKTTTDTMSSWYNRKVKVHRFEPGDNVRVYNPRKGRSPKWQSFYLGIAKPSAFSKTAFSVLGRAKTVLGRAKTGQPAGFETGFKIHHNMPEKSYKVVQPWPLWALIVHITHPI